MDSRRKEEAEDVVIQALGHRERRNILRIIHSAEDGVSYSEILGELGLNTGRMNYHLRQLEGLIERDNKRRYRLTPLGERSLGVLGSIAEGLNGGYEPYLSAAQFSQAGSVHPTVTGNHLGLYRVRPPVRSRLGLHRVPCLHRGGTDYHRRGVLDPFRARVDRPRRPHTRPEDGPQIRQEARAEAWSLVRPRTAGAASISSRVYEKIPTLLRVLFRMPFHAVTTHGFLNGP